MVGITFYSDRTVDQVSENWLRNIIKSEGIIKQWMGRDLSIIGRITLVKTFLASRFSY